LAAVLASAGAISAEETTVPLPGQPTAAFATQQFQDFLDHVRDGQAPYAKYKGTLPRNDACFRAFIEYDPSPITETVRKQLVATVDPDVLRGFDSLASTPAFLELNGHMKRFAAALASGDVAAAEAMSSDSATMPSKEAMAVLVSNEYSALNEAVSREEVQAGFFAAHAAAMPAACAIDDAAQP
jgi:hypothetical protein